MPRCFTYLILTIVTDLPETCGKKVGKFASELDRILKRPVVENVNLRNPIVFNLGNPMLCCPGADNPSYFCGSFSKRPDPDAKL